MVRIDEIDFPTAYFGHSSPLECYQGNRLFYAFNGTEFSEDELVKVSNFLLSPRPTANN
jgi:hypothetical protein